MKFSKLKGFKKLSLYKKVINEIYCDRANNIDFRCTIFDNEQVRHADYDRSNDGIHSNVRGFYKQYFQLLKWQFCNITMNGSFYIFLDQRSDPAKLYDELYYWLSYYYPQKIKFIRSIDSQKSELVQLADLLVGAVSCEVNSKEKKEKLELIDFIKKKNSLNKLSAASDNNNFRVWRFNYNKTNRSPNFGVVTEEEGLKALAENDML